LYVRFHEVLGVGLEDLVDLVEQVVELVLELLAPLGGRGDLGGLLDPFPGGGTLAPPRPGP
jgi:hypothetical protein